MRSSRATALIAVLGGAGAWACSHAESPTGVVQATTPPDQIAFSVYGVGDLTRMYPQPGCTTADYRKFDFWVGEWNVFNTAGAQIGTNIVKSLVGGCVVEENWTAAGGQRGRSLNAFDRDDGQWHQTWVAEGLGQLRMAGDIQPNGNMLLKGQRISANSGLLFLDTYEWTPVSADELIQHGLLEIPGAGLSFPFTGRYLRGHDVQPVAPPGTDNCSPGGVSALSRQLDFWLGSWTVRASPGPVVGNASVESDLSGCLLQEHFDSGRGLQALAFVYYDVVVRHWFMTYMDSQGERIELSGGLAGQAMVMTGSEKGDGGRDIDVRVTWSAVSGGAVQQTWEVAAAGSGAWKTRLTLLYSAS